MSEEERLVNAFDRVDFEGRGKIGVREIELAFRSIGVRVSPRRVKDEIWLVDSDADGQLDIDNILELYFRAPDEAGTASSTGILDLFEFLMYDLHSTGCIAVADAMHIMCRRFREQVSLASLRKFLIDAQLSAAKTITFVEVARQLDLRRKLLVHRADRNGEVALR